VIGKEVDERTYACGQRRGVADIDGVDVFAVAGIIVLEHGHEEAGLDVGADVE
jgi:hypothetical protein